MKLAKRLPMMLATAYRERMKIQKVTLSRGLSIQLYVDDANRIHLMISRPDVYPSELEWKAVMLCMPRVYKIDGVQPEYKRSLHQMALAGVLNTERPDPFNQLQLEMTQHA